MTAALAIDHFAKSYTLRRPATGSYVDGRWVEGGVPVDSTIRAAVFAPALNDVLRMPDGDRTRVVWSIWTRTQLRASSEDTKTRGDLIQVGSSWFRVFKIADRSEGGYCKAYLERDVERDRSVSSTPPVVDGGDWH
ncbi:hypothetical protein [Shinella granuli]|uniref:Head-tail adaptor n=1 Tax=Shinella granuli TaxID=323621 RepID=A0A4R2CKY4_SHIGR|nr:hypothetical protein [Shinella granuli]TCN41421.1 hypothetical protein EV665_1136 [Shinella granuli]